MSFSPVNGGISGAYHSALPFGTPAQHIRHTSGTSQDSYTGKKKNEPGFFKKALNTTLKLGGLLLGTLAIKRYFLSPATVEKIANHIPGFIKTPFNAIANTSVAKTVTGWGESALNQVDKLKNLIFKNSKSIPAELTSEQASQIAKISEKQDLNLLNRGSQEI